MFKTKFAQGVIMRQMDLDPCTMMFATRNEDLCKRVIKRFWKMVANCGRFRGTLPHLKFRSATNINTSRCEIIGTWAGSKSGLADESIAVGHGNEIDKWERPSTSTDGDPLSRFITRGDEFVDSLFILESTPGERSQSRVERGRLSGTNHSLWVPCPHCAKFQPLDFGNGTAKTGITWDKPKSGRWDRDVVLRTAVYLCRNCHEPIRDEHKYTMEQLCVWVPEGCSVDHDKAMTARELPPDDISWIIGEPRHNGAEYSSHLARWHALFQGWGDMAVEYTGALDKWEDMITWITEKRAETWSHKKKAIDWEKLYTRVVSDTPRGVIPLGFSQVIVAYDRQSEDKEDKPVPFLVLAVDPERRRHIVDYGYVDSLDVSNESMDVATTDWEHEDEGATIRARTAALDSGFEPAKQAKALRRLRQLGLKAQLVRGAAEDMSTLYKRSRLGKETQTPGEVVIRIDTERSQRRADAMLYTMTPGDPGSLSVFDGTREEHEDLLTQLLNDDRDAKGRWNRINTDVPNDYRDDLRYADVTIEAVNRNQPPRPRTEHVATKRTDGERRTRKGGFVRKPERSGGGFVRRRT